jgi:hypothetical protein
MSDIRAFITSYSENDSGQIAFAWNGQHGKDLQDRNLNFRRQVLEEVLRDPDVVPIPLVCEIFEAETCFAKEAWGVDMRIGRLAEILLTRGGPSFVEDFFRGKYRSQDTYMATGTFPTLAKALLAEMDARLQTNLPEARRRLLEIGKEDCKKWLQA